MGLFKLGVNGAFIARKYGIRVAREHEPLPDEARRQQREFVAQANLRVFQKHDRGTKSV